MSDFTFTPDGQATIDIGKYAPGYEGSQAMRWGRHPIPGQDGDLKEDLGTNPLQTRALMQFIGPVAADYYQIVPILSKHRRGQLQNPRRGARTSVVMEIRERVDWTTQGAATTFVDVTWEDAVLNQADQITAGPGARQQQVLNQAAAADSAAQAVRDKAFTRLNLTIRARAVSMQVAVGTATAAARNYCTAALDAFQLGVYGPSLQNQLRALVPLMQAAQVAARLAGTAADTQETVLALEVMLFAATQLDAAIRAAQPIPVQTTITRLPGQGIYAFVQQVYGRSGKQPADIRALAGLILRLNPHIRRPSLIPAGTVIVRPA
jgi:hypothetical protein